MVRCSTGGFDVVAQPISIVSVAQTIPFRIAITRSLSFTRLIRQQAAITPLEIRQLVTLHDQVARRTGAFESRFPTFKESGAARRRYHQLTKVLGPKFVEIL
jgi:hypothetical protein